MITFFQLLISKLQFNWDYETAKCNAFSDLGIVITNLILSLRIIAIALSLLFIIISGIIFATSSGDPEKVKQAKQSLTWALVALALAVAFWTALMIIVNLLNIQVDGFLTGSTININSLGNDNFLCN